MRHITLLVIPVVLSYENFEKTKFILNGDCVRYDFAAKSSQQTYQKSFLSENSEKVELMQWEYGGYAQLHFDVFLPNGSMCIQT